MLSLMSCWLRWSSCSRGSPWPAALIAPSPQVLPTSTCCYSSLSCCCRPTTLGTFSSSCRLSPYVAPHQRGSFRSERSCCPEVFCWLRPWSPGAPACSGQQTRGHRNEPFRGNASHSRALRSAPLSRVGCGRAHRGRPPSASLPLSGSDQPLQSAVHDLSSYLRGA